MSIRKKVMLGVANYCESNSCSMYCKEQDCVLFRIETIVSGGCFGE